MQSSSELSKAMDNLGRFSKKLHNNIYVLSNNIFATSECNVAMLYDRLDLADSYAMGLSNSMSNIKAVAYSELSYLAIGQSNIRDDIQVIRDVFSNYESIDLAEMAMMQEATLNLRDDHEFLANRVTRLDSNVNATIVARYETLSNQHVQDTFALMTLHAQDTEMLTTSIINLSNLHVQDTLALNASLSNLSNLHVQDTLTLSTSINNLFNLHVQDTVTLTTSLTNLSNLHVQDVQTLSNRIYNLSNLHTSDILALNTSLTNLSNLHVQDVQTLNNLHTTDVQTLSNSIYNLSNLHVENVTFLTNKLSALSNLEYYNDATLFDTSACNTARISSLSNYVYTTIASTSGGGWTVVGQKTSTMLNVSIEGNLLIKGSILANDGSSLSTQWTTLNTSNLYYSNQGGLVGINTNNPQYNLHVVGDIYATQDVYGFSDARYKKDLSLILNATERIRELSGYTYTRMLTGTRSTGLIAQDVEQVLPEAVSTDSEGKKSIAYGNLAGLLVQVLKELDTRLTTLEARLDALSG